MSGKKKQKTKKRATLGRSLIFRKGNITDFEENYGLYKIFEKEYKKISICEIFFKFSKRQIKDEFCDKLKNYFVVAEFNGKITGYIEGIFYDKYKRGYIADLFVLKKFRNLSIATKMKNIFLKEVQKRKYKQADLDVNVKNPAVNLYKKWGFKIAKYRMVKKLR